MKKKLRVVILPTEKEIWLPVVGYEKLYEVSNLGRIKSLRRDKIMTNSLQSTGYLTVGLTVDGATINMKVHRLVAIAFLDAPPNGHEVNHKDGVKTNNKLDNLEWVTKPENAIHRHKIGLSTQDNYIREKGEANANSKLTQEQVDEIREKYVPYKYSANKLAKEFGVSQSCIEHIINKRSWS